MKVELGGASTAMNTFTISVQILLLFFPFLIEGQSYRTKDVDALCVTVNCGLQSTACFLDGECAKVFTIFRQNDFMYYVYLLSTSSCKVQEGNDNELLKAALLHMILAIVPILSHVFGKE